MLSLFKTKPRKIRPAVTPLTLLPGSEGEHYLQRKYGTTQRALRFYDKQVLHYLSPVMQEFIARQEVLFIATADKHGECDCSFRFGMPGFVRVLGDRYVAYPEYRGNGVLASQGNISENPHIGMILVDFFASTVGLHINGKAKILENDDLRKCAKELPEGVIGEIEAEGRLRPERWIMVEVEEAYIHCSKHIPLLQKVEKEIAWGTDDDKLKRSDFFALNDIPLYHRLGGEAAMQALADSVVRALLFDDRLSRLFDDIDLQTLLSRQLDFLKRMFGAEVSDRSLPENPREFYRRQTHARLNDAHLDIALSLLKQTLTELDVPEHEINRLMTSLSA